MLQQLQCGEQLRRELRGGQRDLLHIADIDEDEPKLLHRLLYLVEHPAQRDRAIRLTHHSEQSHADQDKENDKGNIKQF